MQNTKMIALLLPDTTVEVWTGPESFARGATALMRDAAGNVTLEKVTAATDFMDQIMTTGCFRRGKPIVDPVSREIIGHEMEQIAHPFQSRTRREFSL